jgi:hypothetical protein
VIRAQISRPGLMDGTFMMTCQRRWKQMVNNSLRRFSPQRFNKARINGLANSTPLSAMV